MRWFEPEFPICSFFIDFYLSTFEKVGMGNILKDVADEQLLSPTFFKGDERDGMPIVEEKTKARISTIKYHIIGQSDRRWAVSFTKFGQPKYAIKSASLYCPRPPAHRLSFCLEYPIPINHFSNTFQPKLVLTFLRLFVIKEKNWNDIFFVKK